jgi:hypothetical protein
VPDGRYVVRIEASDNASNAADRALEGSRESGPITIDNTPPQIESEVQRTGGRLALIVRVHDGQSPIQKLEYSLAGGPWQVVYPSDGVADAPDERYEVPLGAESDLDRLVLRAIDLLQNVASSPAVRR